MRVLLVGGNHEIFVMGAAPLGLAYLAATLRQAGHEVLIVDMPTLVKTGVDPAERLPRVVAEFPPELVVCGIRNLDWALWPANIFAFKPAEKVIRLVGSLTEAPVIVGGAGFTICPEPIMRRLGPRFVGVAGEGELAIEAIARLVEKGGDPRNLERAVCYVTAEGHYVGKPVWRVPVLDALPFPARDLLDNQAYTTCDGRVVGNLQTARGCSRACIFCTYPNIEGKEPRFRTPGLVAAELEVMVAQHGLDSVFIVDSIFNLSRRHAEAVCRAILDRGVRVEWGVNFHPEGGSTSLLPLMREAGCVHLALGADSLNEPSLEKLHKGHDAGAVVTTVRRARELEMEVFLSVFLGSPGETLDDVKRTLAALEDLSFAPTSWQGEYPVMLQPGIRIYPGTALHQIAIADGVVAEDDDLLEPRFYISPHISEEHLLRVLEECLKQHPHWMAPGLPHLMRGAPNLDRLIAVQIQGYRDPSVIIGMPPPPPPHPASNRRSTPRFPVDIRGECWVAGSAITDRVTNISRGGLFFASNQELPRDADVEFRLFLTDAVAIEARGRVVWMAAGSGNPGHARPGAGIVFTALPPPAEAALGRYLEELAAGPGTDGRGGLPLGRAH
jgi:hypothetical protein